MKRVKPPSSSRSAPPRAAEPLAPVIAVPTPLAGPPRVVRGYAFEPRRASSAWSRRDGGLYHGHGTCAGVRQPTWVRGVKASFAIIVTSANKLNECKEYWAKARRGAIKPQSVALKNGLYSQSVVTHLRSSVTRLLTFVTRLQSFVTRLLTFVTPLRSLVTHLPTFVTLTPAFVTLIPPFVTRIVPGEPSPTGNAFNFNPEYERFLVLSSTASVTGQIVIHLQPTLRE